MRTKVTLVLLFLNVALFFYIIKFEHPGRVGETEQELRRRVLDGKVTADIRSLEITGGTHTLALAKRGDTWFVTQPLEWPANPAAVSRILTELQFLEHLASFKVSELAQNGQSLADYGLDHPRLTIAITSGDPAEHPEVTRLQIGDITKDGLRLYLLSPDGERIHVVSQSLARSLGLSADDLRTDALFTIPVFEARSLNLQTAAPANLRIRLRRDGSKWSFETPIIARASKAATELAINGLNGLRVASFITSNPPATLPSANPALKITLEGNNRRETLILGGLVHPDATNNPDEYYAQLEGRSALFTVRIPSKLPSALQPGLMDILRTAQVSLRETRILDFDVPAVTALTLSAPNQPELILQRLETGTQSADNSAWQIVRRGEATVGPQTLPADRGAVQRLLDQLSRLTAADFKSDAPTAADLESWGFNRPEREVSLTLGGGAAPVSLQLGTDAKHNVYARLGPAANPGSSIYAVDAEILRELPVAPRAWRDRLLRELPAGARLTALKLTDLASNQAVLDVALDDTGHPPAGTKNPEAIAAVLTALRTLRAKEFVQDQFADKVLVAGEERPWRYRLEATATLVGGAGEQTSVTKLFLTVRVGGDQQLAGSPANEYNAVFSIEQPLLDALWTLTEAPHDPGPIPPPAPAAAPTPAPASGQATVPVVEPRK